VHRYGRVPTASLPDAADDRRDQGIFVRLDYNLM
jgi:hypothetical protein